METELMSMSAWNNAQLAIAQFDRSQETISVAKERTIGLMQVLEDFISFLIKILGH